MTKKDYVKIAAVIAECQTRCGINAIVLVEKLCDVFEQDNPRFDFAKFVEACRPTGKK